MHGRWDRCVVANDVALEARPETPVSRPGLATFLPRF